MKLATAVAVFGFGCCLSLYEGIIERTAVASHAPSVASEPLPPVIIDLPPIVDETPADEPLAVRNRNPLNVKYRKADPWLGQVGHDEQGHAVFKSYEYGVRAAALTLRSYARRHNISTVDALVKRFAEGNQKEYVAYLCRKLGVKHDDKIDLVRLMPKLLRTMARFESGRHLPEELFVPYDVLAKL